MLIGSSICYLAAALRR